MRYETAKGVPKRCWAQRSHSHWKCIEGEDADNNRIGIYMKGHTDGASQQKVECEDCEFYFYSYALWNFTLFTFFERPQSI